MTSRPATLTSVQDHKDLSDRIAEILTNAILDGKFEPGSRLTEAQLAKDLGVSRSPVREALRLLQNRGLVNSFPRRGFFVPDMSAEEIDQIYDLRLCLEQHAGALLIKNLTDDHIAALEAQVNVLMQVGSSGSTSELVEEDIKFHRMICGFAGNTRLLRTYDELTHEMRLGVGKIIQIYADRNTIAKMHIPILNALKDRNVAAYRSAVELHMTDARTRIVEELQSNDDMQQA